MNGNRLVITADSHTQGEPTRLIIGGIIHYPGKTMQEKKDYIIRNHDLIRKSLMAEPRGHNDMFGGFITPPVSEGADLGIVFIHNTGYLDMCGHGTIGLCVTVADLGMLETNGRRMEINIDTLAGRVAGYVLSETGRPRRAGFQNVPSFCIDVERKVEVNGIGSIDVGIAYGGNFFAIVPAEAVDLEICPDNQVQIRKLGLRIRDAVNEQSAIEHPSLPEVQGVKLVTFYGPADNAEATYKNVHVFANGQIDRSPGGTGTSAMLAYLHAKGNIDDNATVISEGLAGGLFTGQIIETWTDGGVNFHTTDISGVAYLTGINHFYLDLTDPLIEGVFT